MIAEVTEVAEITEVESKGIEITASIFDVTVHNGWVTIHNTNTGNHRTFLIETITEGGLAGKRIISVLTGPDRDNPFDRKGFAFADDFGVKVWKRFLTNADGSESDYVKFARMLETPSRFEGRGCRYMIEGRCRRCNRLLTHPSSLMDGMGRICRTKV